MNKVFKALADPTRRQVLELLRKGPMTAGELAEEFEFTKPTMSAHFSVLKEADLVAAEKDGRQVIYRLKLSVLEDALLGFVGVFAGAEGAESTQSKASAETFGGRSDASAAS